MPTHTRMNVVIVYYYLNGNGRVAERANVFTRSVWFHARIDEVSTNTRDRGGDLIVAECT